MCLVLSGDFPFTNDVVLGRFFVCFALYLQVLCHLCPKKHSWDFATEHVESRQFFQPDVALSLLLSLLQDAVLSGLEASAINKKAYYELQAAAEAVESR